jgi:predicted signal transduction protein with EAL and GGDEF domain
MTVVAEGVETAAQRDILTALDCDVAQGYLFAADARSECPVFRRRPIFGPGAGAARIILGVARRRSWRRGGSVRGRS